MLQPHEQRLFGNWCKVSLALLAYKHLQNRGMGKCIASSNKCLTSSNKKLLEAPGLTTRSKDATRSKCLMVSCAVEEAHEMRSVEPAWGRGARGGRVAV